jgi:choline dehydrogenase-like flavoprotein
LLIDGRTLPEDHVIETDVCIVGAGAAGITLAREFIGQPFRVCLLESGGLEFDEDTQSLYRGQIIGHPYVPLDMVRLRYFGGTTNVWEGWCRPLDEIDFETRDWIPYSGWPFGKSHLDPFYKRAQSICQLGPLDYDTDTWVTEGTQPLAFTGDSVVTAMFQFSPPTHFGQVYRDGIAQADNIRTYLYSNVVDIEKSYTAPTVTRLRVACLQSHKFWVSAKLFILAGGTIENARLLLLSNKVHSAGLGNQNDLVGRFFMEHPRLDSGLFLPSDPYLRLGLYDWHMVKDVPVRALVALSPEILYREKLLNYSTALRPFYKYSKGVDSAAVLYKALKQGHIPDNLTEHLRRVIADIDEVAIATYKHFMAPLEMIRLLSKTEQAPNPESRVTLSRERDSLGKKLTNGR